MDGFMTTATDRPPIGQVFNPANIPQELKDMPRWALWKAIWNDTRQKYDKVPYGIEGYGISTKDLGRWSTFAQACLVLGSDREHRYAGLGFVLTGVTDIVGIDLDNCVKNGQVAPWAQDIITSMQSYTETSPSGNGVRILARGSFHCDWNNHDQGIEVYAGHTPRFLTITGDTDLAVPLADAPPEALSTLYSRFGKSRNLNANVIPIEMPELICELALPDIEDLDIPEVTKDFFRYGPPDTDDRSAALHAAGVQLYSAGLSDAEVLSILASSAPAMEIALSHRRGDDDRALQYLWKEHCTKAKPKAITKDSVLADFDDLSEDPVVKASEAQVKKHMERQAERFALQTTEQFIKRRHASWFIKGLLPRANFGVIYGASGSGKSFITFDMIADVAMGRDYLGKRTKQSKVLWIAAEGQEDMRKRVTGYCMHRGIDPKDFDMMFIDEAPNFMEEVDIKSLITQIKKKGEFDIVVVDTLAQVMSGANENSSEDMGKVMGYCKRITAETNAMVIPIHHSGKDESKGARGWSGLRAAADFELEIIRADEDRVATVTKLKGGEDGMEIGFRLETIVVGEDEDGDPEVTCVVHYTSTERKDVMSAKGPKGNNKKDILSVADMLIDLNGGDITRQELTDAVISKRPFDASKGTRDTRKQNVKAELNALISDGFLLENEQGLIRFPEKKTK